MKVTRHGLVPLTVVSLLNMPCCWPISFMAEMRSVSLILVRLPRPRLVYLSFCADGRAADSLLVYGG